MPIYDYQCVECGSTYDVFHKGREVLEDIVCPSCGSLKHQRLIGLPNVGVSTGRSSTPYPSPPPGCDGGAGGCCGGSCGLN
jgi:putative FmdB family regulatory protein